MKKRIYLLAVLSLALLALVGCGKEDRGDKIIIGVSPNPHADIIEFVQEDLKEAGIELEIKEFTDYVTPNMALDSKDIDLNFFQHKPYLDDFNEERGMDLVSLGGIHIEPLAFYSEKIDKIDQLEEGAKIAIPNDAVNGGRALILLENAGYIKLDPAAGLKATTKDIVENKLKLDISMLEATTLPSVLRDLDGAVINGNYALEAGLNPVKDGLLIEEKDSPYVNIIACRKDDENKEEFKKIMEILQSDKIKDFLLNNFDGALVPAF